MEKFFYSKLENRFILKQLTLFSFLVFLLMIQQKTYAEEVLTPNSLSENVTTVVAPVKAPTFNLAQFCFDSLKKFPGGYGIKGPEEIGSLVHMLIESNESIKIAICNSHPDALLLDTDFGLANFGMMAMINKNSEVESRVYQTRNRMAVIRKNRK